MTTLPTSWVALAGLALILAHQLWESRQARKSRKSAGNVEMQVTNSSNDLVATVEKIEQRFNEMNRMLGIIKNNQRTLHDEHLGAIHRSIAVLNQAVQDIRGEIVVIRQLNGQGRAG